MKKILNKLSIMLMSIIIIFIAIFSMIDGKKSESVVQTMAENISNKKIRWGIKRNSEHNQPDVGSLNRNILEENKGICLGEKWEKIIYLTFDNGYEAGYTAKTLDVLKENNVKATFFITAHYLNTASELVERMIKEGHIVANHTVNHKSMPELTEEEIKEEVM